MCHGGLYRLNPGEGDWPLVPAGLPENVQMRSIVVHPRNPNVIFVSKQGGPYRSVDGRNYWERLGLSRS